MEILVEISKLLGIIIVIVIIGLVLYVFIGSIVSNIKDIIYFNKIKNKEEKQTSKEEPIYSNFTTTISKEED